MVNKTAVGVAALGAVSLGGYLRFIRPWHVHRGANDHGLTRAMPGDEMVPVPTHVTTRAVTSAALPRAVWPWLVQMGQDRAGFSTHNWVERLLRSGIPDVRTLHPEWQGLAVGDLVRTNREPRPGLSWPFSPSELQS